MAHMVAFQAITEGPVPWGGAQIAARAWTWFDTAIPDSNSRPSTSGITLDLRAATMEATSSPLT